MLLPQLTSKSSVQFRMRHSMRGYRAANQLADGSMIRGETTRPLKRSWELLYRGLTGAELSVLDEFCNSAAAVVDGLVFLDPFKNLLNSSEDLVDGTWQQDPMASVTGMPSAGSGESLAHLITNVGNDEQGVTQALEISGAGRFCASCVVRSNLPAAGRLILRGAATTHAESIQSHDEWMQVHLSADLNVPAAPLEFAIVVAPGCALEVKGIQLEYQPYPSRYKPTTGRGGVYPGARVLSSSYHVVQQGPDWFDCSFRIEV